MLSDQNEADIVIKKYNRGQTFSLQNLSVKCFMMSLPVCHVTHTFLLLLPCKKGQGNRVACKVWDTRSLHNNTYLK